MTWNLKLVPILITSILCLSGPAGLLLGVDDQRAVLKFDKKTMIAPAGTPKRDMMSMVRHPDGTIYLNFQSELPKLYKSSNNGETWTGAAIGLAKPHQVVQGVGVNHKGRLFLVHQTAGDQPPNIPKKLYGQACSFPTRTTTVKPGKPPPPTWVGSLPVFPTCSFTKTGSERSSNSPMAHSCSPRLLCPHPITPGSTEHIGNPTSGQTTSLPAHLETSSATSFFAVMMAARPGAIRHGSTHS